MRMVAAASMTATWLPLALLLPAAPLEIKGCRVYETTGHMQTEVKQSNETVSTVFKSCSTPSAFVWMRAGLTYRRGNGSVQLTAYYI